MDADKVTLVLTNIGVGLVWLLKELYALRARRQAADVAAKRAAAAVDLEDTKERHALEQTDRKGTIGEWMKVVKRQDEKIEQLERRVEAGVERERNLLVEAAEQRAEIRYLRDEVAELKVAVEDCRKRHNPPAGG